MLQLQRSRERRSRLLAHKHRRDLYQKKAAARSLGAVWVSVSFTSGAGYALGKVWGGHEETHRHCVETNEQLRADEAFGPVRPFAIMFAAPVEEPGAYAYGADYFATLAKKNDGLETGYCVSLWGDEAAARAAVRVAAQDGAGPLYFLGGPVRFAPPSP